MKYDPNTTNITRHSGHRIRNNKISLTQKEFDKRAKKYVSLLFTVFVQWVTRCEHDGNVREWDKMGILKQNELLLEFFELYLTG